jgi:hypothetical protein
MVVISLHGAWQVTIRYEMMMHGGGVNFPLLTTKSLVVEQIHCIGWGNGNGRVDYRTTSLRDTIFLHCFKVRHYWCAD